VWQLTRFASPVLRTAADTAFWTRDLLKKGGLYLGADERTNSVVARGPAVQLAEGEAILLRLDEEQNSGPNP
jgi:hypothetical protein